MRGVPSNPLRPLDRQPTLSEPVGMLGRLGLLLLIVFSFTMAAQLLVGAPF